MKSRNLIAAAASVATLVLLLILLSGHNIRLAQDKQPIAVVSGQKIYEDDLTPLVRSQLLALKNQEYQLKRSALDRLVEQKLLEAEAKRQGLTVEQLLEREVYSKAPDPTPDEVKGFYLAQKDRLNRPFEDVQAQLRQSLKQAKARTARQDYLDRLRKQADVAIFLPPPKVEVSYDPARLRGDPRAPVIIVEFSDFQCPYCRRVEPTLKQLLTEYQGKVSLAYRDFPLREIHPQAQLAAVAARCAGAQGKFWEYHDLLFSSAKLDRDSLLGYARTLGLDAQPFDACLAGGKFDAQIEKDLRDGENAGVEGTPSFFINGVLLSGAGPAAAIEKIIDEQLAALKHAQEKQ